VSGTDPSAAIDPEPHDPFDGPRAFVDAVQGAVAGAADIVKPGAAVVVATGFGFPLGLSLVVLVFLFIQSRLDHRDPKLRAAPASGSETTVAFEDEELL
jgi:hypothetical protein